MHMVYIPVVGLEASGSGSLADTLGESLSVGVPGCRWLNLGEARLRFGVLRTGASAVGDIYDSLNNIL